MKDKEALEICYARMRQNDYIADQAYCNGNKGLCKIKENENNWLSRLYILARCELNRRENNEYKFN